MSKKKNEALLEEIRDNWIAVEEEQRETRAEARKDLEFIAGEQWNTADLKARDEAGRPHLVVNKLPQFVQQVVNEQRQNRPGAKVSPISEGARQETAEVMEGLIRHIEYISKAEVAYDTAFEYSASSSFGVFRLTTEYLPRSFDLELKVQRVPDPFTVYFDPNAKEIDASDAKWAFVIETITRKEFARRYPHSDVVGFSFFDAGHNPAPEWIRADDKIQLAEYWKVKEETRTLQRLSNGMTVYADEALKLPAGVTVEEERDEITPAVCQYYTNGVEILEETEWLGKWIPLIPVFGKELYVAGKRKLFSLIRFARDPQQLYNFYRSAEAEAVGTAPKAPFVGYIGQFKSKQEQWEKANTVNYAYLEVDPVSVNGQPAPLPQRQSVEPAIQALSLGAMQASDDIKATTGIFDPSLGNTKADMSGKAIQSLQKEGDQANFHLIDNLSRALWHGYRQMLEIIPKLYKGPREVRILGKEETQKIVRINQEFADEAGNPQLHNFDVGRYDVAVDVGPSYQSKRQEAAADMADFAKSVPELVPQYADLYVKAQDWPLADEIAERVCPPQFQQQKPGQKQAPLPPAIQQMVAQHSQLVAQVHQLSQVIEQKQVEQKGKSDIEQAKLAVQLRIAEINAQVALLTAETKTNAQLATTRIEQDYAKLSQMLGQGHELGMQAHKQEFERSQNSADRQHEATQLDQQQAHAADQQANDQQFQQQQSEQEGSDELDKAA